MDIVWGHLDLPDLEQAKIKLSEDKAAAKIREEVDELFYELILLSAEPGQHADQLSMWKLLINMNW